MMPGARSMNWFRRRGYMVCKVEQTIHMPHAPFPYKRDAFGFGDLLVCKPGWGKALVQVTSSDHVRNREAKAKALTFKIPHAKGQKAQVAGSLNYWLESGGRFLVHGWRKGGPRGKAKKWILTELEVKFGDAPDEKAEATGRDQTTPTDDEGNGKHDQLELVGLTAARRRIVRRRNAVS